MTFQRLLILMFVVSTAYEGPFFRADENRYVGALSDASRVQGTQLHGWHQKTGEVHLDTTKLNSQERQLVWLRDRSLSSVENLDILHGFIEFESGDRFPGRIIRHVSQANEVPAHFLVESKTPLRLPEVDPSERSFRVSPKGMRRIVFSTEQLARFSPKTIFLRDGRTLPYRSLRWKDDNLDVLTQEGSTQVNFTEIAEIHFSPPDPWSSYYHELSILSPKGNSQLLRLETIDGLLATGSEANFEATARAKDQERIEAKTIRDRLLSTKRRYETQLKNSRKNRDRLLQTQQRNADKARKLEEQHTKRIEGNRKRRQEQHDKLIRDQKANHDRQIEGEKRRQRDEEKRLKTQLKDTPQAEQKRRLNDLRRRHQQDLKRRKDQHKRHLDTMERQRKQELRRYKDEDRRRRDQLRNNSQRSRNNNQRGIDRHTQKITTLEVKLKDVEREIKEGPNPDDFKSSSDRWYHKIHPVWSFDPLWIRFSTIRQRQRFLPYEFPLSRLRPVQVFADSGLGGVRPPQVNRNVQGGPLRNAKREHGWGFGVHADCELHFEVPENAKIFRTRVGLNLLAGTGGCVRVAIYLNSKINTPLFQSEHLIGSETEVDTGPLDLTPSNDSPRRLILVVDSAHDGRPTGADPLNIRDIVDWIEPTIKLDANKLMEQIGQVEK